ncbi:MAG: putative Cation-transporting P-type ATPase [Streblomastix strix]|uniref:Putative Cation-transporting P-type ATPase n=1 Tax=Streblomastix strix TaxID=222440 RepID=A0A5J4W514_9EUKA|nr:MAG: putative Cation-transporting P-type ATPase [Streblomastix strix]
MPLLFVVIVSMLKELLEDIRRFQSDRKANGKLCRKLIGSNFEVVKWKDLQVGDIVRIECDEMVPADLLILFSPLDDGLCNIETSNLDGETNLKSKQAVQIEGKNADFINDILSFRAHVTIDQPNAQLYVFNGTMAIIGENDIPLSNKNVILRSCALRNTSYILALVVVKLGQVLFVNNDILMYDPVSDTRANARTSNLNESLGQIQYIFSDKTGTLTQNKMEFFKCTIGGEKFGTGISEVQAAELQRRGNINVKASGRGFEDDALAN